MRGHVAPECLQRGFNVAQEKDPCIGRKIVRERSRFVKKEREIVFDPRRENFLFNVAVNDALFRVARKLSAPALTEGEERLRVNREFVAGKESDFLGRFHRALRIHIEPTDGFDFVIKEIQSEGTFRPHGENVDDAAANGKFTGGEHLLHIGVARGGKALLQRRQGDLFALMKEKRIGADIRNG